MISSLHILKETEVQEIQVASQTLEIKMGKIPLLSYSLCSF